MKFRNRLLLVLLPMLLMACGCVTLAAGPAIGIKPNNLFTDNMVLQRGIAVVVWGTAEAGGVVTVTLCGQKVTAVVDRKGNWTAKLRRLKAGGPHGLTIAGRETITIRNVLIGDVWICSGQSNMAQGIGMCANDVAEIAAANHPNIRFFMVKKNAAKVPQENVKGTWKVCSPETVCAEGRGGLSGAAYYFARNLQKEIDVPIGLIQTCWGGTLARAWTSAEALTAMPEFRSSAALFLDAAEAMKKGTYSSEDLMAKWWAKNDSGSASGMGWADPALDASAWKTMQLPQAWEKLGGELGDFDGIMWLRRAVVIPAELAGKDLTISLGPIDDYDTTFFNGTKVGAINNWRQERTYRVPGKLVRAGENTIAVRVLDTGGGGGLYGNAGQMKLGPAGGGEAIWLAGAWRYKVSAPLSELSAVPKEISTHPNTVTVLYNGMIAPLLSYGIKGALWYQGESDAGQYEQYRRLLPILIADWRKRFGIGKFPFLVVQLANFTRLQRAPSEGGWAMLREAQLLAAQNDATVGLTVTIDIGNARDIHPRNKQDVGKRLALSALKIAYGKDIVFSGPTWRDVDIDGDKMRLKFENVGGGLVAKGGGKLKGFAIAGKHRRFVWADAVIDGKTIIVSSENIAKPVAVRYNWASNPIGNLYNKEGLPASGFRTDGP